jgi:hypothetical protein
VQRWTLFQESGEFSETDIDNAMPGVEVKVTSALRVAGEPRTNATLDFDIVKLGRCDVPEYVGDAYRQISMFKVRPLPAEVRTTWATPRYPYVSKFWDERLSWPTRREADDHYEGEYDDDVASARSSAAALNRERGIGTGKQCRRGPRISRERKRWPKDSLPLDDFDGEKEQSIYMEHDSDCVLDRLWPDIFRNRADATQRDHALMGAKHDRVETPLMQNQTGRRRKTKSVNIAAPSVAVQNSQSLKKQFDFGVRRWLAEAGCGHDLVSSSLMMKGGGKTYTPPCAQAHEYGQWSYINRGGDNHVHPAVG